MVARQPFHRSGFARLFPLVVTGLSILLFASPTAKLFGQAVNVPTWRYDNMHQGQNTQETILTPTNVNTNTFGKLFSQTVDGAVFGQPLYISNLSINSATHNVVFVATEHDSVYAFDADSNGGSNSAPLWQASMISTAHGAASGATTVPYTDVQGGLGDIHPEIGISSTPVIDAGTQTIFVVAKSKESGNYVQRLHALNILNGSERAGSPVVLAASVPGNGTGSSGDVLAFSPLWQNQRAALGFFNGNVYIAFGSHGDNGTYHGWLMVYNEATMQQTAAICTTPNGYGGGIWGAGAGIPIDTVSPNGRIFVATANGDMTAYPVVSNTVDLGQSILRYDLSNNGLAISDAFTTYNELALSAMDLDQGSGGILMLPDQPGPYPHLMLQGGKEGRVVVLNRDQLNGFLGPNAGSNTNAVQDITSIVTNNQGFWSTPAYWNGNVYLGPELQPVMVYPLTNGVLATSPTGHTPESFSYPGISPVITSNGTQNGILWAFDVDAADYNGPAVLRAYNAVNIGQELYNSTQNQSDNLGQALKFTVPVVTNGKVYVGTGAAINVFGLFNQNQQAPAPSISPAGGAYGAPQQITIKDSNGGANIYYTLDGSTPTPSSSQYTAPFTLSSGATVHAIASVIGYLQSAVTSATYSFTSQTAAPQFSPAPGSFTTTQTVTITDTTPNATIYYTTDGSTPTTSSTRYSAPVQVTSATIFNAIATAGGLTNSNLSSATYAVQLPGSSINYANGFANATGLTLNGSAVNVDDSRLQITTGVGGQTGSFFYNTPTYIQAFTTDFAFQLSNAVADGFTFTIQNNGPTALGGGGSDLGYGTIGNSIAVKFDFYNNSGEGSDSTGLYVNGASPTVPAVDMTSSGVILSSGDAIDAHITYDGANLAMTLTDIVVNKVFTHTWQVNIPSIVGGNTAYIGFTGASGGQSASQKILSWTLSSQTPSTTQTAPPTFNPAPGTYPSAQSVTLSDPTTGSIIYYTTDGSTPTTASAVYKSAIPVSSGTVTINAIGQANGLTVSSMSSAAYTIQAVTAPPTFSPPSGTYTSTQSVTISDPGATSGATIYYTTNGSMPTTASAVYSGAITVTATTTIEAIAVAGVNAPSNVVIATYVIQSGAPSTINFAGGFSGATGLQLNGSAKISSPSLQLTDGGTVEASSAYWATPVNIQAFTTNFTFQLTNAYADGFTFTIQNTGLTALGSAGAGLGYAGIGASVAVKFDIYSNGGEGTDSTGVFTNGATPTVPAVDLTSSGVTLASGDTIAAQLVYNGATLTLNLTDIVTGASFTQAFTINIPSFVGANTAYVGFTGGTGGASATQNIKSWTFNSTTTPTAAEPSFSPTPGTFTTAQNVMLTSATPMSTIYYTVDGSTPTHSSTPYAAPIVASGASLTIRTFASATGYLDSPINVGTYQIQPTVATPMVSPASGTTFASTLSVSITDANANAMIYYSTDGSIPTTSSNKYGGAFSIASSTVVNAIAVVSGMTNSSVGSASYTLVPIVGVAIPAISPASGTTFASTLSVSMTDATVNTAIYYTTDGSMPTTSSNKYGGAFSITSSTVVNSIAVVIGTTNSSSVASASYTLVPTVAATPAISPASGASFSSSLVVSITDATAIAAIYYTTDGSAPTISSTKYMGAFSITSSTVVNAIAVASGMTNSSVATASYTLVAAGAGPAINYSVGFASTAGLTLNGIATNAGGPSLNITTTGLFNQAGSAFYNTPTNIQAFTTDFTFQLMNPHADGFTFVIQNNTPTALGGPGGGLGYGPSPGNASPKIPNSLALKFDFYSNAGEGSDSTGVFLNGATPTTPAVDMTSSGVLLTSGNTMAAHITYDGTNLVLTLTDTVLNKVFTHSFPVNIPATIGSNLGYIGFAGGTGGSTATQKILTWTLTPQAGSVTQTPAPTFSPAAGSYPAAQSVTITDSGATIYYTTDGSMPTTSSAVYKAPISVSSGAVTINAIAQASGSSVSTISSAAYIIQAVPTVTATPTFSPVGGTYPLAQSVTISDATTGAIIYYTTDGSMPTVFSAVYKAPVSVSSGIVTIQAVAQASGSTVSSVGSAVFTVPAGTATPTFSPAAGTYPSAQSVTISDATTGAIIHYTTDGSTPTPSSTVYSAPISVSSATTINALAVATGSNSSAIGSAAYVIQSSTTPAINFPGGFSGATGLQFNGGAKLNGANLQLTVSGTAGQASSAYWTTPVNIQNFTTNFTFQLTKANADGFTFTIQNAGLTALGSAGGSLGYGGIKTSVAVKFDIYSNSGEGTDSTGVYTNGATPTVPAVNLTSSGITLASGDTIAAQVVYNGTTLTLSLTDMVTNKSFTQSFTVNIPTLVGAKTAYVGFTGGTGGSTATQDIQSWGFTPVSQ